MPKSKATSENIDYVSLNMQLSEVLTRLQHPDIQVDEAVQLYEKGLQLTRKLEAYLQTAENTVKQLKLSHETVDTSE